MITPLIGGVCHATKTACGPRGVVWFLVYTAPFVPFALEVNGGQFKDEDIPFVDIIP